MKTMILTFSCLLLGACGGKGAVDLGGNVAPAGWADTKASAAATAAPTSAKEPQILYDGGEAVYNIAVDETTIAAQVVHFSDSSMVAFDARIDTCQVADCMGTRQTICRFSPVLDNTRTGRFSSMIVSHGEIIWTAITLLDNNERQQVMACATTGCPDGPRVIGAGAALTDLAADSEYVYWSARVDSRWQVARCLRTGCKEPETLLLPIELTNSVNIELTNSVNNVVQLALDESNGMLFLGGDLAIASMPRDFSAPPALFYTDPQGVRGLAVANGSVYFALSTLTGEIRSCPVSGCQQASEFVVSAPRWPFFVVADRTAVYWVHAPSGPLASPGDDYGVLSEYQLNGLVVVQDLVSQNDRLGCSAKPVVMNSHHVYWCDVRSVETSFVRWKIRMLER